MQLELLRANVTTQNTVFGINESQMPHLEVGYKLGTEVFILMGSIDWIDNTNPLVTVITSSTGFQYVTWECLVTGALPNIRNLYCPLSTRIVGNTFDHFGSTACFNMDVYIFV